MVLKAANLWVQLHVSGQIRRSSSSSKKNTDGIGRGEEFADPCHAPATAFFYRNHISPLVSFTTGDRGNHQRKNKLTELGGLSVVCPCQHTQLNIHSSAHASSSPGLSIPEWYLMNLWSRRLSRTRPLGVVLRFLFLFLGAAAVIPVTGMTGFCQQPGTTTATYDSGNKLTRRSYPNGSYTVYSYDGAGNLTQALDCTFSVSTNSQTYPAAGGTGTVTVTVPTGCPWTATTGSSWIAFTNASGTGNGTISYSVAVNKEQGTSGPVARIGFITIGNQTITVSQDPAGLVNSQVSVGYSGSITVTTAPSNPAGYLDLVNVPLQITNNGPGTLFAPMFIRVVTLQKNGTDQDPTRPYRLFTADDFVLNPIAGGLPGCLQSLTPSTLAVSGIHTFTCQIIRGVPQSLSFFFNIYASSSGPVTNRLGPRRNTAPNPIGSFELVIDAPAAP